MTKYLLFSLLTLFSLTAQAHQADLSSTMLVEQEDGSWVLQIRAALTAFEYEVHAHYGEKSYPTAEKFKELVIEHVEKNLSIHFNGQNTVGFQNAYVQLGHETNILFEVLGLPETINTVSIKNSSFKDIHRNQSALLVLKKGFEQKQFVLNNDNLHTVELAAVGNAFELQSEAVKSVTDTSSLYYKIFGGLFLLVGALVLLRKIKNK